MPEFPATGMGAAYIDRFNCFIRTSFFLSSFRSPWFLITVLWFWVRFQWTPMLLPRIRLWRRPSFLLANGSSASRNPKPRSPLPSLPRTAISQKPTIYRDQTLDLVVAAVVTALRLRHRLRIGSIFGPLSRSDLDKLPCYSVDSISKDLILCKPFRVNINPSIARQMNNKYSKVRI